MKKHTKFIKKHYFISILAVCAGLMSNSSYSEILFSENFNATPDWQNVGSQRCHWLGWDEDTGETDCANVPLNFDLMYMTDHNPTNPMCQINSLGARGLTGKGLRVGDESNGTPRTWGSDCQIAKYFPQQHPEIWASYFIHYNPNMIWENGTRMSKIFRIGHYNPLVVDGTAGTSSFNANNSSNQNGGLGRTTAGLFILDTKRESVDLTRFQQAVRCSPLYKCGSYDEAWFQNITGTPGVSWDETLGDDQWHHIEIGIKMNSIIDANDGVLEVYFDGVQQTIRSNIPWRTAGVEANVTGFNMFTIAGNSSNVWAGQTDEEQWMYDVDDVRICTNRCPNLTDLIFINGFEAL